MFLNRASADVLSSVHDGMEGPQDITACTAGYKSTSALSCREVEAVEERAVDRHGNKYMTIKELQEQEAQRRAGLPPPFPLSFHDLGYLHFLLPLVACLVSSALTDLVSQQLANHTWPLVLPAALCGV